MAVDVALDVAMAVGFIGFQATIRTCQEIQQSPVRNFLKILDIM